MPRISYEATLKPHVVRSDLLPGTWKMAKRLWGHSLHRLAPYNGTFPPSLAHYFIKAYSDEGQVVLDPFSGSGTTALEACATGRVGFGNDPFPYAHLLTRAKVRPLSIQQAKEALVWLRKRLPKKPPPLDNPDIEVFFHPETLGQILRVREVLLDEDVDRAIFLKSLMCGVLHGPSKMFLSLPMKDTAASSPNYIKRYAEAHKLEYPRRDIFDCLQNKIGRALKDPLPQVRGMATDKDVRQLPLEDESVDLIVTSPPYLHVLDYSWHHWVRLWFLGIDRKTARNKMFITGKKEKFVGFMRDALSEMHRVLKDDSTCVIVIGDVRDKKNGSILNAAEMVATIAHERGFTTRVIVEDPYPLGSRSFVVYNEQRYRFDSDESPEVCAVPLDRCLVLQKGETKERKVEVAWGRGIQSKIEAFAC